MLDTLNRVVIFQTNCEMNNQYDTNGFSELINGISRDEHIEGIKKCCSRFGGSEDAFKTMQRLDFRPIDEF